MKRAMVLAAAALISIAALADGSPFMGGSRGRSGLLVGGNSPALGGGGSRTAGTSSTYLGTGTRDGGGLLVGGNSAYLGGGTRTDSPMLGGGGLRGATKRIGTRFAG